MSIQQILLNKSFLNLKFIKYYYYFLFNLIIKIKIWRFEFSSLWIFNFKSARVYKKNN